MSELKRRFEAKFSSRARSMKTLTHFLDTPKRSEISALLQAPTH
jgi:hypothetical protein